MGFIFYISGVNLQKFPRTSHEMKIIKIVKASMMLIAALMILIPLWISHFDTAEESISIEELLSESRKLQSSNLKITGKALFDFAYLFEKYDREGGLDKVVYYVPLVPSNWTRDQQVKAILILEPGRSGSADDFEPAVRALESRIDSLKAIKGDIEIRARYPKYELFKFEDEAIAGLADRGLRLAKDSDMYKLVYSNREKPSVFGTVFLTLFVVGLGVFIYVKIK
jgi:hypothetical protein